MNLLKNKITLIFSIIFILMAGQIKNLQSLSPLSIPKQTSALNFNHHLLKIFSLGQTRLISDVFWITTLLESDLKHYKKKDLNSWMFHRFNTISNLDPFFIRNYQFGGQYLSIIKDDIQGAEVIFKKGLDIFPNDYDLNYHAGYLYAFEIQDFDKAFSRYILIKEHSKAPKFIESLLTKLKFKSTNNLDIAFELTLHNFKTTKDKYLKSRLKSDLYAIKATIDLKCLNNSEENCNLKDFENEYYIKIDGKYKSKKTFKKFDLKIRNRP
jgi:tetratricopeptide (TPR) repeat protein